MIAVAAAETAKVARARVCEETSQLSLSPAASRDIAREPISDFLRLALGDRERGREVTVSLSYYFIIPGTARALRTCPCLPRSVSLNGQVVHFTSVNLSLNQEPPILLTHRQCRED